MLVEPQKSIIPACDMTQIEDFVSLVEQTHDLDCVGGYKIGFSMGLGYGVGNVVNFAREHTNKPIIYDHQKAGTDIPDTGTIFAKVLKKAGVDYVILFPQAGPATAEAWIKACQDQELEVIIGVVMTHDHYMEGFGGYLTYKAVEIFQKAAHWGVTNFVIPGNNIIWQTHIRNLLTDHPAHFFAPGVKNRSHQIDHYIVGRKIYSGPDNYRVNTCACQNLFL